MDIHRKEVNMQNLQVMSEMLLKPVQGKANTTQIQSLENVFLEILTMMSETSVDSEKSVEITHENIPKKQEDTVSNELSQVISLVQMLIPNQVNQLNPEVKLSEKSITQSDVKIDVPIQSRTILNNVIHETNVNVEENVEFKLIDIPINEKIVIETIKPDEIETHYKVLNQVTPHKVKQKREELVQENPTPLLKTFDHTQELKLKDVEYVQFKQSMDEMKSVLEQVIQKNDDQTIVFKLKPEGLAEIVIKFESKMGKVVLDISTPNRIVEQLIQKELPVLRENLKSYQIEVNLNEMSYKQSSDQSNQQKYDQQKIYRLNEEEVIEDEWVYHPQNLGFYTYV